MVQDGWWSNSFSRCPLINMHDDQTKLSTYSRYFDLTFEHFFKHVKTKMPEKNIKSYSQKTSQGLPNTVFKSRQEGSGSKPTGRLQLFYSEFAYFLHVCVDFLQALFFFFFLLQ